MDIISSLSLKPLFVFKVDAIAQQLGVFVRNVGVENSFPDDLKWEGYESFPTNTLKTSLWILPVKSKDGKYVIDFESKFQFEKKVNVKINTCEIEVFDQTKEISTWNNYKNLDTVTVSHNLNFEAKVFSISHKVISFIITGLEGESKSVSGWFFGKNDILTADTLLKFDGLECDIVDNEGKKHDFHVWCGIRSVSGEELKPFLSINNSNGKDKEIGEDCPIVWRKKGLLDDTIFPNDNTKSFAVKNERLCLGNNGTKDFYSESFSWIDLKTKIKSDNLYSWFIKEGEDNGRGTKIFPFFKNIKKDSIVKTLGDFIKKPVDSKGKEYNLLYFFQINRFVDKEHTKSIITWIVGGFDIKKINEVIKEIPKARREVDKAGIESLSPQFNNLNFGAKEQILLEHTISNFRISIDNIAFFNPPNGLVEKINDLKTSLDKEYKVTLTNFRKGDFERKKIDLINLEIEFNNLKFNTKEIGRESDNGTFFGFKIRTNENLASNISGALNDGTFAFDLEDTGKIEANIYFSFQLQKGQKPLYIWEYHKDIEEQDTIIPCYAIEDFKLPVKSIIPLSTDISDQDRFIADNDSISISSTGTLRPEMPLIIPLQKKEEQKYWLSFSENINVGQDFFFATELLLRDNKEKEKRNEFEVVVLGNEPQTAIKVNTPFGTNPKYDNGKWVVARKNSLSANGNVWEILNESSNDEGVTLTFPPQVIGEAFRKTNNAKEISGEPTDGELVKFKFSPPATVKIANSQLSRQMHTAPWNLRNLFGKYGDSNPGLRLLEAQFELLYGMSTHFKNKDAFIAEMENKLGQMVKAPRGRIVWESSKDQSDAFKQAYSTFVQILKLYTSRLAIYEVSASTDKFQPAKFETDIDYFFRLQENQLKEDGTKIEEYGNGAKLKFPFQETDIPNYLNEVFKKYHNQEDGLAGGFHWGLESKAVYHELMTTGLQKGSSSGEIENLAFSSLGGYGKQVARFANDKTIIKSITSMGRTHFYAVERIGRIGVFWNKAKHVIEYERTVVPSIQFKNTQNEGRIIVRKVREFIEILEPERRYPEFGGESYATGSVKGTHFKSLKIPVNSTWGKDLCSGEGENLTPYGWEIPLWNKDANSSVYPFPQIMLKVMAAKESGQSDVLCNIENPENIYFYTDVREQVAERKITAETNDWPSIAGVDFTLQPFENIYLGAQPCLNYNDPKLANTPLPSPIEVLPGFERFTFKVLPSDMPISANGAYNDKSTISAKLRTVTMQRKLVSFTDKEINKKIEEKIGKENFEIIADANKTLINNLNGYKEFLSVAKNENTGTIKEKLRLGVIGQLGSFFPKKDNSQEINFSIVDKILNQVKDKHVLFYLQKATTTDGKKYEDFHKTINWQLPTIVLWNQLVGMLEATVSTVDKHYTLAFDTLKIELFESIDNADLKKEEEEILSAIKSLKVKIDSAEKFIDLHLGFFDAFLNKESDRINTQIEITVHKLDDAKNEIKISIEKVENFVAKLIDDIDIPANKKRVGDFANDKINETIKTIKSEIDKIKISEKVRTKVITKLDDWQKQALNKIQEVLNNIPDTSSFDDLKLLVTDFFGELKNDVDAQFEGIKNGIGDLKKELNDFENIIKNISEEVKKLIKATKEKINGFIDDKVETEINEAFSKADVQKIKKICKDEFFNKKDELIKELSKEVLNLLIEGYQDAGTTYPPFSDLFNKIDDWMKGVIADFNSLLNKIKNEGGDIETAIEKYIDPALDLYNEYKAIDKAIKSGDKDSIIKEVNKLSQAINQDFGNAVGKVTESYYKLDNIVGNVGDLNKELQNTLFNYRSVVEDIKAVDLGINRQTVELIYNFKNAQAPKLLMTPVMGKLEKLNDGLSALGVNIPYGALDEKFIAPLKEWGSDFAKSFADNFPISNLLKDIGGFKFDNLLPFLKGDDSFFKAVKVESKVDEKAMKAWVKADLNYTFTEDNTLMSIGPLKIRMLKNAKLEAHAYESIDIDKNRVRDSFGTMKATFEISLSNTPLMIFRETVVAFKNGKYDFDLDPSRMEMPGLLKIFTDASKNIPSTDPSSSGEEGNSPFKRKILKYNVTHTELEIPIGFQASLDIPPLSVGGGTTAISNLSFGGHFLLKAIDDTVPSEPKFDFNIGLGFYFGKKDLPFNFTAFILGGGGYIDCSFKYQPSVSTKPDVTFIMSVNGSAAFIISAGWITGSIMILAGIEIEYRSGESRTPKVSSTRIEIYIAIIGVVDILGLVSVYLNLRLAINYQSDSNGTVLYGVGRVKVKIRLCRFVTISVNKNYTMILKGESKSVKNENSEKIAASLN